MFQLGVLDFQIGLLLTIGRLVQVITALIGGALTDRFGRNVTTFFADCVSWSIPTLIWAFAQDFRWFIAAAVFNSFWQISNVSWECLWIDDMSDDANSIRIFFNWLYICGLLAVFFAPIAGFFVGLHGVIPVMRVLFVITFLSMTAKFIIIRVLASESKLGLERMAAVKTISFVKQIQGYKEVFLQIIRSKGMLRALALQSSAQITIIITTTFFALYITQNLGLPEEFLAFFPILRSAVMISFLFFIQHRLNKFNQRRIMLIGLLGKVLAHTILLSAPEGIWIFPALFVLTEAAAAALLIPRIDILAANEITPKERARIRSLFNVIILAASSPFIFMSGVLADLNRQMPFVLNIVLFCVMVIFVMISTSSKKIDSTGNTC